MVDKKTDKKRQVNYSTNSGISIIERILFILEELVMTKISVDTIIQTLFKMGDTESSYNYLKKNVSQISRSSSVKIKKGISRYMSKYQSHRDLLDNHIKECSKKAYVYVPIDPIKKERNKQITDYNREIRKKARKKGNGNIYLGCTSDLISEYGKGINAIKL